MNAELRVLPDLCGSIDEVPADSIVSKNVYEDEWVKVILFGFAPGQELSEHTASKPAVLHFLEGEAQVTLGEQAYEAGEGFWAHMPARLPHSVLAKTAVKMLLLLGGSQAP